MKKSIVSGLLAAAMLAAPASADTTLRAFIPVTEARPEAKLLKEEFADQVAALTSDELQVKIFYAGGLGFEVKDLLRHLRKGTVDIGVIIPAYYSRDMEPLSLMLVDGGITDPERLADYRELFAAEYDKNFAPWNIVSIGTMQPLILDHSIYCKEPVTSLEELKSKKLRVWTKHQLESFQSLDIPAQMISQEELYVALQTGVVDCAIYLGELAPLMGLQEVAPYETYFLPFIAAPAGLGVSERTWKKLSEEQRAALQEAGQNATVATTAWAVEYSKDKSAARKEREEKGIIITEGFSDADQARLIEAMRSTWREMAEDAGSETLELVDRVLAVGS